MASQSLHVHRGYWKNHEASFFTKYRYLTTEGWANVWTNFMAISTALILAKLVKIAFKGVNFFSDHAGNAANQAPPNLTHNLAHINVGALSSAGQVQTPQSNIDPGTQHVLEESHSSLGAVLRSIKELYRKIRPAPIALVAAHRSMLRWLEDTLEDICRNLRRERHAIGLLLLLLVISSACFLTESLLSVFNSFLIAGDNLAMSDVGDRCSILVRRANQSNIPFVLRDIDQAIERDAASYARSCSSKPEGTEGCGYFKHQAIPIHVHHNQPCPFDKDICAVTGSGGLRIETELVPASYIGINAPETFRINKTVTCVPLSTDSVFVNKTTVNGTLVYFYNYGSYRDANGFTNYTWMTPAGPLSSQYVGYNAYAFASYAPTEPTQKGWTPHPLLTRGSHQRLFLLLIGQHNVNHVAPRTSDPIFLTNTEKVLHYETNETVYTDSSDMARPLACLESVSLCTPDGLTCRSLQSGFPGDGSKNSAWPPSASPKRLESLAALALTYITLAKVDLYYSIAGRLGSGLVANEKLSQTMSSPLEPEHWKNEAIRLVETSLAGWSGVARDISRATWTDLALNHSSEVYNFFDGISSPEFRHAICQVYIFHSDGWKNINMVGTIVVALVLACIFLTSLEVEGKVKIRKGIGHLFLGVYHILTKLGGWVVRGAQDIWSRVKNLFK